jgi:HlyD family secretion protein
VRFFLVVVVAIAIAGGVTFLGSAGRGAPVRLVPVARSNMVVPVLCGGALQPPPGGELRAADAAIVASILVKEGARVRGGEALLRLDAPDLVARTLAAEAEVGQLREAAAVAESERQAAAREVSYRRRALEADARLLDQGAIARSAYDGDELALRQAEARMAEVEVRVGAIGGTGPGAAAKQDSRLGLAEARARDLRARLDALTVRAPADGVAYGLPAREGEAVVAGQVVASVTEPERPHVLLRVDAPDLPRVAVGQRFSITFDGLPGREWEGLIDAVGPGLRDVGGREVGEVRGVIARAAEGVPFGASVNARIIVGEKPLALVMPRAALQRDGDRRYVYVDRAGRAQPRDVSVGLVGLTQVEVTGGLTEGERVVLPGEVPLSPGLRLAPLS